MNADNPQTTADGIYVEKVAGGFEFGHIFDMPLPRVGSGWEFLRGRKPLGQAPTFSEAMFAVEAERGHDNQHTTDDSL